MSKFILGAIGLAAIAVGGPASAADVAVKGPPVAPPFSWAGAYIGAGIGGIWASDQIADLDGLNSPPNPVGFTYPLKDAGFIGSGVLGYNVQYGPFLYGIEADLGGIVLNKTIFEPNVNVTANHLGSGFYSDVAVRLGFAFDHALVYAKSGWALYEGKANIDNTRGGLGGGIVTAGSFGGWTIGGGLEYAFSPVWSAKVEYLHFDFGSTTANLLSPVTNTNFRFANDLTADAVSIGVNYHFGH